MYRACMVLYEASLVGDEVALVDTHDALSAGLPRLQLLHFSASEEDDNYGESYQQ